ncbi:hypothetical protein BT67DRAFT_433341 [Trichocladium antarcticum]|uniref:Uncharacterized protein n=1 Tax=Trichocladium antarcticum TaxID=1450529 RepID=A0AAN6UMA2_9PEZI|nr:hypothetical protein BT67DRAFT_433341 [Trichocladium antarcticum]
MDIALYIIASDAGGLPKAKIGLLYYIPVKTVTGERYPNGDYISLLPTPAVSLRLRSASFIASNSSGLPKAKIGLLYYIPVKTITGKRYPNSDYILKAFKFTGYSKRRGHFRYAGKTWHRTFEKEGYAGKTWYRIFEKEGCNI